MDDGRTNIDVVFRNGLKDYEVLPPQDVWNDIHPVIRKNHRPFMLLRVAAVAAVVISLGILAIRLSSDISTNINNRLITQNPESVAPDNMLASAIRPVENADQDYIPVNDISQQVYKSVTPVKTDNLKTAIQNFTALSVPEEKEYEVNDNSQYDIAAVDYDPYGYVTFDVSSELEMSDNPGGRQPGRWSISALVSPTYQSHTGGMNDETYSRLVAQENASVSYSGGLALSYKISKRFSVQSGIYYSTIGKELAGISAYSGFSDHFYTKGNPNFEVLTTNGSILTENNDIFLRDNMDIDRVKTIHNKDVFDPEKAALDYINNSIHQNFSFLELPVVVRYKIIDKALDFNLIGGVSSNLLVDNSVYASSEGNRMEVGKTGGLNIITFSSSVGMGMEYNISGNLSLNLEPTLRYFINPFSNMSYPGIHPYYFSVFSGISYKF